MPILGFAEPLLHEAFPQSACWVGRMFPLSALIAAVGLACFLRWEQCVRDCNAYSPAERRLRGSHPKPIIGRKAKERIAKAKRGGSNIPADDEGLEGWYEGEESLHKGLAICRDLEFNSVCECLRISPDERYMAVLTGQYPPQLHIVDVDYKRIKYSFGLKDFAKDFAFLTDNYRKQALLFDHCVQFHTAEGVYDRVKLPLLGSQLCYDSKECVLYVAGYSPDVFRFDLNSGSVMEPLIATNLTEINSLQFNPVIAVLSCCGNDGLVETWDTRGPRKSIMSFCAHHDGDEERNGREATALAYSPDGMRLAVGLASGVVRVYDVQDNRLVTEHNHKNGYPIKKVFFHEQAIGSMAGVLLIGSADERSTHIWRAEDGYVVTSLEIPVAINDFVLHPSSGLFFLALARRSLLGVYVVPNVGGTPECDVRVARHGALELIRE